MEALRNARHRRHLSQRDLALRAGLSFRGYQLLETPGHNSRLASLERVAAAIGLPPEGVRRTVGEFLSLHPDSIHAAGLRILADGDDSWTVHLFDFVDAFRRGAGSHLLSEPPPRELPLRLTAIMSGTVERLCGEADVEVPPWCEMVPALREPWFVSGVENLKASALAESPLPFRRRNVFVLDNFLMRA